MTDDARRTVARAVGERLKLLRERQVARYPDKARLEKDRVARIMGQAAAGLAKVDPAKWSKWEHGTHLPDVYSLVRIARRSGVSLDWLFGLKRSKREQ